MSEVATAKGSSLVREVGLRVRSLGRTTFPRLAHKVELARTFRDENEQFVLSSLIDPERGAIDVGANIGHYAVALSKLVPMVIAFEPDPELAVYLRRAMPPNVEIRSVALSDSAGVRELRTPILAGAAAGTIDADNQLEGAIVKTQRVVADTLDSCSGLDVGFLKVDVEGHELAVLRGGLQFLRKQRPNVLVEIEERHRAGALVEVRELFASIGYRGFFIRGTGTHVVEEFDPATMADESKIDWNLPRRRMDYVNNFVYVPDDRIDAARARVDPVLRSPEYARWLARP